MRLAGKTAVVTGAARGIGLAIATGFAREGARVALADIDIAAARRAAATIAQVYGGTTLAIEVDVASPEANQAMVDEAVGAFEHIDILVCNAGIVRQGRPIEDITADEWRQVIDVNLMSCIYATQSFVRHAKPRRSGRIVYLASVAGQVGGVSAEVTYSVTKAGVLCLNKAMARQLAPFGINVNAIAPGTIETAMTDVLQYDPSVKESVPLKRYGQVDDIAAAALYLASGDGDYVTGTTLDVNGGLFMR